MSEPFRLQSPFAPAGDQPRAITELAAGLKRGDRYQTLLGVTGSGKTMTMANVIQQWAKPTLVLSHNKTLAAQLYGELKSFFPHNAVEYFISYYDYYQPEAYVPSSDTYIEKDAQHQRGHRPAAAARHVVTDGARRRRHRVDGLGHLRTRRSGGLSRANGDLARGQQIAARRHPARAGRHPVPPQ